VVTNVNFDAKYEELKAFTVSSGEKICVRDQIIQLLTQLHNYRDYFAEIPVFFVNSTEPHGKSESEFLRFIHYTFWRLWKPIHTSTLKPVNLRVMRSIPERRVFYETKQSPKYHGQSGMNGRQIGTRKVRREFQEMRTKVIEHTEERPIDVWDFLSLGITRWIRPSYTLFLKAVKEPVTRFREVDEPIYEVQLTHFKEEEVTEERIVTWDFSAKLPINYNDNFDRPMAGREVGEWMVVSRKTVREWDDSN
jgi:hypothetical protein